MITGNQHFGNREPRRIPTYNKWITDKVMPALKAAMVPISKLEVSDTEPVQAIMNNNRWVWVCECGGAEFAWEEGLGMCMSCLNAKHQHKLRRISFPVQREKIEEIMIRRPTVNRHWTKETLKELEAENEAHKKELLPPGRSK